MRRLPLRAFIAIAALLSILWQPAQANTLTTCRAFNQPSVNGDANIWGTLLNSNFAALDNMLGETNAASGLTGGTVTVSVANAQDLIQLLSGTLTSSLSYQLPSGVCGFWVINNTTTGSFTTTVITTAGGSTGVIVAQGAVALVYSNGTNVIPMAVAGPAAAVNGDIANYMGTTGGQLGDSGVPSSNLPTTSTSGDLPSYSNSGGKFGDSGVPTANLPTTSTSGDLAAFANSSGKLGDSGVAPAGLAHGSGRLTFNSATQVNFCPFNGNAVAIDTLAYPLPSACVTASNAGVYLNGVSGQSLAASTVYYVAIWVNSSVLTLGFWTEGTYTHTPDTTAGNVGTEVIETVAGSVVHSDQSLVGMVATDSGSHFALGNTLIGVISWFNRRNLVASQSFNTTTSSTSPVALSAPITFISWGDDGVLVSTTALAINTGSALDTAVGILSLSGSNIAQVETSLTNTFSGDLSMTRSLNVSEAAHYSQMTGNTQAAQPINFQGTQDTTVRG